MKAAISALLILVSLILIQVGTGVVDKNEHLFEKILIDASCAVAIICLYFASVAFHRGGHHDGFYKGYEAALKDTEECNVIRASNDPSSYPSEKRYKKRYAPK